MTGKQKCKLLKQIRAEIARQNDIDLVIEDCPYQGDCTGTCPRCEAEVRALEAALEQRREDGLDINVAGVAADIVDNHVDKDDEALEEPFEHVLMGIPMPQMTCYVMVKLRFSDDAGPHEVEKRLDDTDYLLIGSQETCDVVIRDKSVYRRHARLSLEWDGKVVIHNNSGRKMSINGERLTRPVEVQAGDMLTIGNVRMDMDIYGFERL